ESIFTPATKEESGHDENISFERMTQLVGDKVSNELRQRSIDVYRRAADYVRARGIIIADTKFEWGRLPPLTPAPLPQGGERGKGGDFILIDEVLTPDSSRFWPANEYRVGVSPPSFDKQFVRDWLETTSWDKNSPPPELPADVVERTREKYLEAYERVTGKNL